MQLKELMLDTKSVWVDYPGCKGFKIEIANLSRKALAKLRKACVSSKFDRRTHQKTEELDEDLFVSKFAAATVKNWSGLTFEYLETLILINTEGQDLSAELPYSQENAELLVANSTEFDTSLNEMVFDLETFRTERES